MSARCERGSIIITSNKGLGERGELPGGSVTAPPVLDRLLHHSHVLNIRHVLNTRGESCRLLMWKWGVMMKANAHDPPDQEIPTSGPAIIKFSREPTTAGLIPKYGEHNPETY